MTNRSLFCFIIIVAVGATTLAFPNSTSGQDTILGEIKLFTGDFAPFGWDFCDGRTLNIIKNETLFSIIGTKYGGDGKQTFALPDLRDAEVALRKDENKVNSGPRYIIAMRGTFPVRKDRFVEALLASIRLFAGDFVPGGWAACDGTVSSINSNSTLYSIVGPYYGGDGKTSFALPNLKASQEKLKPANAGSKIGTPMYIICTDGMFPSRN